MATGLVSGIAPGDNWQLIQTITNTSASNITFTGITGYKKLLVVANAGSNGGSAGNSYVYIGNNGTYYGGGLTFWYSGNQLGGTSGYMPMATNTADVYGYCIIENVDQNGPHIFETKTSGGQGGGCYTGPAISQLTLQHDYSLNSTARAYLYGVA